MGIFAKKIKKYVASSVYSLAGDEDQEDPITLAIFGSTMRNSETLGEDIVSAAINAKRYSTEKYYKYFLNNNNQYLGRGDLVSEINVDADVIAAEMRNVLSLGPTEHVRVHQAFTEFADIEFFALQWLSNNYPNVKTDEWTADYDDDTKEIIVDFLDDGVQMSARFAEPADMTWAIDENGSNLRRLLYVSYSVISQDEQGLLVSVSPVETYIYRMGTGNTVFDSITTNTDNAFEFAPTLALKKGTFYTPESDPEKWEEMSKGYKKLTGGKLSELIEKIEDNENLDDIDFIYLFSGYSINTKRQEGLEYLYRFCKTLMDVQTASKSDYTISKTANITDLTDSRLYDRYVQFKNGNLSSGSFFADPENPTENELNILNTYQQIYGEEPPRHPKTFPKPPAVNELMIRSGFELHEATRMKLEWNYIEERIMPGNAKRDQPELVKVGEYWAEYVELPEWYYTEISSADRVRATIVDREGNNGSLIQSQFEFVRAEGLSIRHQVNPFYYKEIIVVGFNHKNYVYKAHAVSLTAKEAMAEEDDSGFIIPLHLPTVDQMSSKAKGRLNRTSSYLVFNAYERVVTKWYQRGFFKIIISIVVIVFVAWLTAGTGLAAVPGLLGTNAAVGAALGLSGVAAALAGAAINALAAIALTSAIGAVSTKVFGEKWGQVIAVIASFVIMNYAVGLQTEAGMVDWGKVFSADNLINLTNTASRAYVAYLNGENLEIQAEIAEAREEYEEESAEIADLMAQLDNNNIMNQLGVFNWGLIDYGLAGNESRESFLSRTTMTGSDIVNISHAAVNDFVAISLDLPGAIV